MVWNIARVKIRTKNDNFTVKLSFLFNLEIYVIHGDLYDKMLYFQPMPPVMSSS